MELLFLLVASINCDVVNSFAVPVILAPYGLAGKLTGGVYSNENESTQKTLDEWRQFLSLPPDPADDVIDDAPPLLVEVVVGKN